MALTHENSECRNLNLYVIRLVQLLNSFSQSIWPCRSLSKLLLLRPYFPICDEGKIIVLTSSGFITNWMITSK